MLRERKKVILKRIRMTRHKVVITTMRFMFYGEAINNLPELGASSDENEEGNNNGYIQVQP